MTCMHEGRYVLPSEKLKGPYPRLYTPYHPKSPHLQWRRSKPLVYLLFGGFRLRLNGRLRLYYGKQNERSFGILSLYRASAESKDPTPALVDGVLPRYQPPFA